MKFISLDVEASHKEISKGSLLSLGATLVTREKYPFDERVKRGFVFYAELQPELRKYLLAAIKVGASELKCLEEPKKTDLRLDTESSAFDPYAVFDLMGTHASGCLTPGAAFDEFGYWVRHVCGKEECIGLTDTVFFDSGFIKYGFDRFAAQSSPFGHRGLCLSSYFKGMYKNPALRLSDLNMFDWREHPHRADEDSAFLADHARELFLKAPGSVL